MSRIITVHLLVGVGSDGEACNFASETFGNMPLVLDWGYSHIPQTTLEGEISHPYMITVDYYEGQFIDDMEEKL